MKKDRTKIEDIPAILYGDESNKLYLFVHGKFSNKEEAEDFANIIVNRGYQILSFDLPEHGERKTDQYKCSIQNGIHDLSVIYNSVKDKYKSIALYACSLGAYFSLAAYQNIQFDKCLFISPILNMGKLIKNMMEWSNVTEKELQAKEEIETSFCETLSWDYYQYVKNHPIKKWSSKTCILYGENDDLTERNVLDSFVEEFNCSVSIMDGGEHYFHTPEQVEYLRNWIINVTE